MEFLLNYYFDFGIIGDNIGLILEGFKLTLMLSIIGGIFALIWGLILAVLRQLPGRATAPIRWLAIAYIDAFRGIPMLLILLLVSGTLSALASQGVIPDSIGIPTWFGQISPFWYGVIALTITYGAYMAEVYRAGIEAVPRGQTEAARSLGMSHAQAMRYVIVPQAVRKVIPPLLNDFIALMKDTSLVGVLGLVEVVEAGNNIEATNFNGSGLIMGAILFLIVTIPLARLVDWLIARDQRRTQRGGGGDGDGEGDLPVLPQAHGGSSGGAVGGMQ